MIGGVLSALSNTNASYRRKENMLAPDIPVYVLGEVQQGGLIGKPASGSKNKTFVISHKSEEERTRSLTSTTRWLHGDRRSSCWCWRWCSRGSASRSGRS